MRKGQFGRELLVLFILNAILLAYLFFFFSEQVKPPPQRVCTFKEKIKCFSFKLHEGVNLLSLNLYQETGAPIEVTSLVCTKKRNMTIMPPLKNPVLIPNKERSYISGGNSGNVVNCTDEDGRSAPKDTSADAVYKGGLYLVYVDNSTGEIKFVNGSILAIYEN